MQTVSFVDGDSSVGIYVSGNDFGKGDTVLIGGTPHEAVEMRRMQLEGEAVALIVKTRSLYAPRLLHVGSVGVNRHANP